MIRKNIPYAALLVMCSPYAAVAQPDARHGLAYDTPAATWDEGVPLGNGLLGALVWGDGGPLRISLDRTDLWDLRPVPEFHRDEYSYARMRQWVRQKRIADLRRLYEDPYSHYAGPTKIPAGRIELEFAGSPGFQRQRLDLASAVTTVELADGVSVETFVHAELPVGLIRVRGARSVVARLVAPPFGRKPVKEKPAGMGDLELAHLGYAASERHGGATWTAYQQQGWQDFRFAVVLAWRRSASDWLGVWSVQTGAAGNDPLAAARAQCETVLDRGFENSYVEHQRWWDAFWAKSSVRLPQPTLERLWYQETYKFGAAARADTPPITLQGPWTADNGKIPPWKGDYHHDLNTELTYWPCYAANHLDGSRGFLEWLWKTKPNAEAWTRRFFDMPGLNVPMTTDLNGEQIGGWHQYTHSATTAAWLAHHFHLHWRYSMDRTFLRKRAYPWLHDTAVFLEAVTELGSDGKRRLPLSSSPEINDNRLDAWFPEITNYDLALIRWAFATAAELADEVSKADDAARWWARLDEMPPLALAKDDGRLLVAPGYPLAGSHRHFSHLMAVHPLGLCQWEHGADAQRTIKASLAELDQLGTAWWTGYSFAWLANLHARARNGARAAEALETFATAFCLRNGFHVNGDQSGKGYSRFTYRPFTLEGNFAVAAGIQEMLLQSYSGAIRVFPAIPGAWKDVAFRTLRAEGAFLVSAERSDGETRWVEITAERGGLCTMADPFDGKRFSVAGADADAIAREDGNVLVRMVPGQRIRLTRTGR